MLFENTFSLFIDESICEGLIIVGQLYKKFKNYQDW